jgi:hypothetical protein
MGKIVRSRRHVDYEYIASMGNEFSLYERGIGTNYFVKAATTCILLKVKR